VISNKKELSMQAPGGGLVAAVPAVTLALIVAEVLTTPLPQPDFTAMFSGRSWPSVSFQFSPKGSGSERFGYVQEWADKYGVPIVRKGRYHNAVFSYLGVEFTAYAVEDEEDQ
jgi:hypothetical protein